MSIFSIAKNILRRISPQIFLKLAVLVNGFNGKKIEKKMAAFTGSGVVYSGNAPQIIVSLTSYPARLPRIHYTLFSLLNQTKKPDKIILWLGKDTFPNREADLDGNITALLKYGITIEWCEDIRSYTKLIPAYQKYGDSVIVTADDDVYYGEKWLEHLYNAYCGDRTAIHCHRGLTVAFNEAGIAPLHTWEKCRSTEKSYATFLQGIYGVLYPPHSLYADAVNAGLFLKLSPTDDDTWFWAMAVMNKTKIKSILSYVKRNRYTDPEKEFDSAATGTLHYINHNLGHSAIQLSNILGRYPAILENLKSG
jgi:hypothetical protein